jgi:hypothetical protein
VTNLKDAANPEVYETPIDLWRNDGWTDYSHHVNVDDNGIAWTSGRGGIRGYATSGRHRDPYTDRVRTATPWKPVLAAGGGVEGTNQPVRFMHNSERPVDGSVRASDVAAGDVVIGTERTSPGRAGRAGGSCSRTCPIPTGASRPPTRRPSSPTG